MIDFIQTADGGPDPRLWELLLLLAFVATTVAVVVWRSWHPEDEDEDEEGGETS